MIISCPQCNTRYRLDDHLLKAQENKVRCSRCRHVFLARPGKDSEQPAVFESDIEGGEGSESRSRPAGAKPAARGPRTSGRKTILLLCLLLLLLLTAGGYLYFPQLKAFLPFLGGTSQTTSLSQKQGDSLNDLSQITFTDVRQYMVDNEKIGKLLIIEGKAVNESQVPVEMVKVQSAIFDGQGQVLESKTFHCGNTLSLFQLQVLNQQEMESALTSKVGVLTNNSNLRPGQEVSFMTVFFNPPETMAEFSLKVVQATPVGQD